MSIYEGGLTTIFLMWTSGAVLAGYMLYLGANAFQLAMVASIPLLAQVAAPIGSWIMGMWPRPKLLTIVSAFIGRVVWFFPALMLLLPIPEGYYPLLVIAVMAVSFLFQSIAGPIWATWMGEVVPEDTRGSYFGFRGGVCSIVGFLAMLAAGLFLDHVEPPWNYSLVLAGAVFAAFGGIAFYGKQHVPPMHTVRMGLREVFARPLGDQNFRRFMIFLTYWQASVFLAAAFVYPFFLDHLQLSFSQIAIYQSIAAITTLVLARRWGKVADRVGNKAVLAITTFIAGSALPLCWMLARPGDPTMIFISGFIDGLAWSAIGPAIFNLSLVTAPGKYRGAYLGVLACISGIAGFLGGMLSAPLLNLFALTEFRIPGFHWSAYHTLFLVSAIFRTQAWRFIQPVKETRSWKTRDVLRAARSFRFLGFFWR